MNYNQNQKIPNNFPKFQEDLIEVMRDVMIWNLEKEKANIECQIHNEKLEDTVYIHKYIRQLDEKIERLKNAYNPFQEDELF